MIPAAWMARAAGSRRGWRLIGGAVVVIVSLLLFRAALSRAYDRGQADCRVAHAAAAQEQARVDQARVDKADAGAAAGVAAAHQVETVYVDRVRTAWRDRPDPVCLDADGVRMVEDADAALARGAAGDGAAAVPGPAASSDAARE